MNWPKMLPIALAAVLYSDCIAKFYYASVVRENIPGEVRRLRDRYLDAATGPITRNRPDELYDHLFLAAADFNRICRNEDHPESGNRRRDIPEIPSLRTKACHRLAGVARDRGGISGIGPTFSCKAS